MLMCTQCGSHKKHARTNYTKLVFVHSVCSMGPECVLVRSGHEMSTHYFSCVCAPVMDPTESTLGHVILNL
jgi:hypothetical protein